MLPTLLEAPLAYMFSLLLIISSITAFYNRSLFYRWLMYPYAIYHGQKWYTLFTSVLVHLNWPHFLLNTLFVIVFMGEVEYMLVDDFGHVYGRLLLVAMVLGISLLAGILAAYPHRANPAYTAGGASALNFGLVMVYYAYLPFDDILNQNSIWAGYTAWHIALFLFAGLSLMKWLKVGQAATIHWYGALAGLALTMMLNVADWYWLA